MSAALRSFTVRFRSGAPGGYAGLHFFTSREARAAFIELAAERGVGPEWIAEQRPA